MSTPNARDVLHVPGRLVKNPTSLSLVFPHGGTALGIVRAIVFKPEPGMVPTLPVPRP